MNRLFALLTACVVTGGCATTVQEDGTHLLAPTVVSDLYSRTSMQIMLAIAPNENNKCTPVECAARAEFDKRVARIGTKLAAAAYRSYPDLAQRVPQFNFSIVDKAEAGTASAAGGYIAVLRPISGIALSDEALSFVMAREVGHVVLQHHERNTATSLVISVLASVLAPVVNVAKILAVTYSSSSSAVAASSVTSAASFASSRAIIESYWPKQRQEADETAVRLVGRIGYDTRRIAAGFAPECSQLPPTKWVRELHESMASLASPSEQPALPRVALLSAPTVQTVASAECTASPATPLAAAMGTALQTAAAAECTAAFVLDVPAAAAPAIALGSAKSSGESDTSVVLASQPGLAAPSDLLRTQPQ